MLSRREFSALELQERLLGYADAGAVDAVLRELVAQGYLDERRAASERARRWARRGFGRLRAEADLRARGFPEAAIVEALEEHFANERQAAAQVLASRFPTLGEDARGRARAARFLLQRGFTEHSVVALLGEGC